LNIVDLPTLGRPTNATVAAPWTVAPWIVTTYLN
jgi:hypothetical protein